MNSYYGYLGKFPLYPEGKESPKLSITYSKEAKNVLPYFPKLMASPKNPSQIKPKLNSAEFKLFFSLNNIIFALKRLFISKQKI